MNNLLKSVVIGAAGCLLVLGTANAGDLNDGAGNSAVPANDSQNQLFQSFDNQVAVGAGFTSMGLFGNNYTSDTLDLSATKLFDNNLWLSVAGAISVDPGVQNGANNDLNGSIGYAIPFANIFQVIPNVQFNRMQTNFATNTAQANAIVNDQVADLRVEAAVLPQFNIFADAGYGIAENDAANNPNSGASSTMVNGNSGMFQDDVGFNMRPVASVPLLINVQYSYVNFNQTSLITMNELSFGVGYNF